MERSAHRRRRRSWLPLLATLVAALAALACASALTRPELTAQLRSVGARATGSRATGSGGKRVRVVPIHADTRMEALARLGEARSEPRSSLSRDLGQQFKQTATRRMTFVVGGVYADLTDQVVLNALEFNKGRQLRGLTLVYVATKPPSEELVAAAKRRHIRLYHRPLVIE